MMILILLAITVGLALVILYSFFGRSITNAALKFVRIFVPIRDRWTWMGADGRIYEEVQVQKIEDSMICFTHKDGQTTLPAESLVVRPTAKAYTHSSRVPRKDFCLTEAIPLLKTENPDSGRIKPG